LKKQILTKAQFQRDVLKIMIKIILFLTAGNTTLRGNEGKNNTGSEGNFLRTIKLNVNFDPVICGLL